MLQLLVNIFQKVIRSGDPSRASRFHTLRGDLIPTLELLQVPLELLLRLFGIRRKGPWLSRPAIIFLSRILNEIQNPRVLEIGGGQSSQFFAKRATYLKVIEEDEAWAKKITEMLASTKCEASIETANLSNWLTSQEETSLQYDIVLIDGGEDYERKSALEYLPTLNKKAIYILDNSDREIFSNINFKLSPTKYVRLHGLIRHPFQATETTFYWFS